MNSLIDFDRQSEVAIHFNQTGHNYIDDLLFKTISEDYLISLTIN